VAKSTHYTVLGVAEDAGFIEIRRAYRALVLRFHPDRSGDRTTTDVFVRITEAYQVLSDAKRRAEYDASLRFSRTPTQRTPPSPSQSPHTRSKTKDIGDLAAKVAEAAALFSAGKYEQAAFVARLVLNSDPRRAMAHAILGDIARGRHDFTEALRRYSLALQAEPNNAVYLKRYEDLLAQTSKVRGKGAGRVEPKSPTVAPVLIALTTTLLLLFYVALSREEPVLPSLGAISTWTYGLLLSMGLSGLAAGFGMSMSGLVDRFGPTFTATGGRLNVQGALMLFSIPSVWLASAAYFVFGLSRASFLFSASRFFAVGVCLVGSFALAAAISPNLDFVQVLLWGSILTQPALIAGWATGDGFRVR
jgi:curved DNA-binding protein CbpA